MNSVAALPSSTGRPASSAGAKPSGNLDAAKAKLEAQLADWVHCVSSKTPEGKAKIAQLTTQLDAVKAQMKTADDTASPARAKAPDRSDAPTRGAAGRPAFDDPTYTPSAPSGRPAVGSRLDIVA